MTSEPRFTREQTPAETLHLPDTTPADAATVVPYEDAAHAKAEQPEMASPFDSVFEQCQALEELLLPSEGPHSHADVVSFPAHAVGDQTYVLGRARQRDDTQRVSSVSFTLFHRQENELGGIKDEPLLSICRVGDETLPLSPADIANGGELDEDRESALQSGLEALEAYLTVAKEEYSRLDGKKQAARRHRRGIAIAAASLAAVVGGGAGAGALVESLMIRSYREDVATITTELEQARTARDTFEATVGEKCLLALRPYGETQEFMGPRFVITEDQAVDDIAATDACGPTRIEDRQTVREYREVAYRVAWREYNLRGAQKDLEGASIPGAMAVGGLGCLLLGTIFGGAIVMAAPEENESNSRARRRPDDEQ
jgi:hypothetical protein